MSRRAIFVAFGLLILFNLSVTVASVIDGNAGWAAVHALATVGVALLALLEWSK